MIKTINYVKMHGLGNDFVIVNQNQLPENIDLSILAQNISSRHLGIGADQFIIYRHNHDSYDMTIYNQDGSEASICGNAARCLASLIHDKNGQKEIILKIIDRDLECIITKNSEVIVNMGKISFDESWMPSNEKLWEFTSRYSIDPKEVICVHAGNPHLVIFGDMPIVDREIIGSKLQNGELFPGGVNVNFADVRDDKIYLKVWERGTGFTLACGSGACASFAAAEKLGFIMGDAKVVFALGALDMSRKADDIMMRGPAAFVARGEFYYD